ncbi:MAG: hypothetical protein E6G67_08190 [Actinobacteria bacterium]|nr:MAG: hypothetical protein E6G67_08190 [Actinomycetota bacterium]
MREPQVGTEGILQRIVTEELSADRWGNRGVHVLSTPGLAVLFEQASIEALQDFLEPGEFTVGTELHVHHLALLEFEVEARDEAGPVGKGSHVRAVLDRARFDRGVERRRIRG